MKRLFLLLAMFTMACSLTDLAIPIPQTALPATQTATPLAAIPSSTPFILPLPSLTPLPSATTPPAALTMDNIASLSQWARVSSASLRKVVFSPDGKTIAAATGNTDHFGVTTWSVPIGQMLVTYPFFTGIVWDLAYSPDGKWIATAANDTGGARLQVLDAAAQKQIVSLDGPPVASSVAFSPDGKLLAVGGVGSGDQGVIWIYTTATWKRTGVLLAPGQNVLAIAFTRDSARLMSSGTDGKIRMWSLANQAVLKEMFRGVQANRLALSADNSLLATTYCSKSGTNGCEKGGVVIWRTADWGIIQQFRDIAEALAFSPDGSMLATGSGVNDPVIRIRRTSDWSQLESLPSQAYGLAWAPDNHLLASMTLTELTIWGVR